MYEDDEELDQTKAPGMRGSDPAPEQRGAPMMQTTAAPGGMGGGDIRTMAAGGAMGGRQMPGQMPWHQAQQGQPNWGSIVDRFRQRFQQHNPFARMQGGFQGGAPQGGPQQGAPVPQPGAAPAGPPQGGNPWAARIAEAAQRFGGNRPSGGIMGGRGQY